MTTRIDNTLNSKAAKQIFNDEESAQAWKKITARQHLFQWDSFCILRNHHDAEESVQNALGAIFVALQQVPLVFQDLLAWARRIVRNKAIDSLRRAKTRRNHVRFVGGSEELAGLELSSARAATRECIDVIDLLGSLPAKQRNAVTLRYLEGESPQEIADAMKITMNAASQNLVRGLNRLRQLADTSVETI